MGKKEYIQLPPFNRGTDPNLVKLMWVYVQLPEEEQKEVEKIIMKMDKLNAGMEVDKEDVHMVSSEHIEPFRKALKEVIGTIIFETGQFACWLYETIYVHNIPVAQLIDENPESEDLIQFMDQVFKDLKTGRLENN